MARRKGANTNDTWSHIFDQIGTEILDAIDRDGFFDISADTLRNLSHEVSGPDVRNLAKFDKRADLPNVFKHEFNAPHKRLRSDEFINILPLGTVTPGEYTYRLGRFNAYAPLTVDTEQKPTSISFPDIETITPTFISKKGISENTYIDLAVTSGILDEAFNSVGDRLRPVMHGRLRSGEMSFKIGRDNPQTIKTGSNQLEIDATFENSDSIVIIEAKAVPEEDFLVRQLFYPYYVVSKRGVTKRIRPTFLLLQEGNFYFNEYEFTDPENYSTIRLVRQRAYRFEDPEKITISTIRKIMEETAVIPEPSIPFPQANSRTVLVKSLSILNTAKQDSLESSENDGLTPVELAEKLGLDPRQGSYYGNLLRYLGLATQESGLLIINSDGEELLSQFDSNIGRKALIKRLLQHAPFRAATQWYLDGHLDEASTSTVAKEVYNEIGERIKDVGGMFNVDTEKGTFTRRVGSTVALIRSSIFDVIDA